MMIQMCAVPLSCPVCLPLNTHVTLEDYKIFCECLPRFLGEPMTEDEIRELIEEADIDDNGVIDYNEFYSMMDQKPKSTPK